MPFPKSAKIQLLSLAPHSYANSRVFRLSDCWWLITYYDVLECLPLSNVKIVFFQHAHFWIVINVSETSFSTGLWLEMKHTYVTIPKVQKTVNLVATHIFTIHKKTFKRSVQSKKSWWQCFGLKGVIFVEFVSKGQTINAEAYTLNNLRKTLKTVEGKCWAVEFFLPAAWNS